MKAKKENKKEEDGIKDEWVNKDETTTRVHKIGDTNYIVSYNFVPTEENKKRLEHTIKRIQNRQIEEYSYKYRQGKLDEMIADLEKRI